MTIFFNLTLYIDIHNMDEENKSNKNKTKKKAQKTRDSGQCLGMFITTLLCVMVSIHVETNKSYV